MMIAFARRLKSAMEQAHINQSELSMKTGIGKSSISQYISGTNAPIKGEKISTLAEALGVTTEFLLGYDHKEPNVELDKGRKITLKYAARCLGKSDAFLRDWLLSGKCPFGTAVQGTGCRVNPYINPVLFKAYMQTDIDDAKNKLKNDLQSGNMVPVELAAKLMGKSPQFIQLGLQQNVLPIGAAVKTSATTWDYYISPKLFADFTGIDVQDGSAKARIKGY